MTRLVALALVALAPPAVAELYQWTDASGVRDVIDFFTLTVDGTAGRAILKPR